MTIAPFSYNDPTNVPGLTVPFSRAQHRLRISPIRYADGSRQDGRPRTVCQLLARSLDQLIYFIGPPLGMLAAAEVYWPVKATVRIARSCITTTTNAASSATRDRTPDGGSGKRGHFGSEGYEISQRERKRMKTVAPRRKTRFLGPDRAN